MKIKHFFAVLLTAVFFASILPPGTVEAENVEPFRIDQRRVLQGMKRSWLQGYEPTISQNTMTFVLPVLSDTASGAIETEIILADEKISPFKLQTMKVKTQSSESGVWAVRFQLNLHADRKNGDYAATLRITGKDKQDQPLQSELPYVFRIRDGAPSQEIIRMRVDSVQSDFQVGEDGAVTITLTNPCRTVPFEQPVLQISDFLGDIIPQSSGVMYLNDLAPGESVTVRFPMTVLPKAAVAPHVLKLDMSWKALGETVTQTENHTLPVTQEIRLEHGGLRMADSVIAGDPVSLSLPLMNRGKADVIDVMATLTLPGITDRQSVLVGTIGPGETKTAQLSVAPGKNLSGEFTGTLTVEGADNDGNPTKLSLPVSLTVEKPAQIVMGETQSAEEKEPPILLYALSGGCGLLLIVCVIQGAVLRGKIRRLEEGRL